MTRAAPVTLKTLVLAAAVLAAARASPALAKGGSICSMEWKKSSASTPVPDNSFEVQGDDFGQGAGYICSCDLLLNNNKWANVGGLVKSPYVGWKCVVSAPYPQHDSSYCGPGNYYVLQDTAGLGFKQTSKEDSWPSSWISGPEETGSGGIGICRAGPDKFVASDGKLLAGSLAEFAGHDACQYFNIYSNMGTVGGHTNPGNYDALVC